MQVTFFISGLRGGSGRIVSASDVVQKEVVVLLEELEAEEVEALEEEVEAGSGRGGRWDGENWRTNSF